MDLVTYQAIREQWERDRKSALDKASRLGAQIRDLDKTWKLLKTSGKREAEPRNDSLLTRVEAAVDQLPDAFDSPEVWERILSADTEMVDDSDFRANVSGALKRLVKLGTLRIERPGQGRRPARYAKVSDEAEAIREEESM